MTEETQSRRRVWWEILSALTPLILGLAITGVGTYFTHVYNFSQLQLNQLNALDKFRGLLTSDNPFDREFAYASFVALGYEDLAIKLVKIKQDVAGRDVIREVKLTGAASAKQEASALLDILPVHVYIHIPSKSQRQRAEALREVLQTKGYVVPGLVDVSDRADLPKKTNVRYFNEADKSIAETISNVMKEQGTPQVYAQKIAGYKVKPGTIEIWFSAKDV